MTVICGEYNSLCAADYIMSCLLCAMHDGHRPALAEIATWLSERRRERIERKADTVIYFNATAKQLARIQRAFPDMVFEEIAE